MTIARSPEKSRRSWLLRLMNRDSSDSGVIRSTPLCALIAQAKTGSGKTAAFALVLLANLKPTGTQSVQTLVLCPTRELADQVAHEIRRIARAEENIKILTLCGGSPIRPQLASLEHGALCALRSPPG